MDFDPSFVREGLIIFILLVVSIVFHEWGHALMADLLGDDTPRSEGRVTLNPLSHLDMVGTVLIPLVNIFVFRGSFNFIGWGKPVMTNPSNYANRQRDDVLVSLAGPAANLLLALVSTVAGSFIAAAQPPMGELVYGLIVMNVGLAIFNLIPLPPLDGATLMRRMIGMSEETYFGIARWTGLILLVAMNMKVFQHAISVLIGIACYPYALLSHGISPDGFRAIFAS